MAQAPNPLQMIEPLITIGVLYMSSSIDFTNPQTMFYGRVLYAVSQLLYLGVLLYLLVKIGRVNDQKEIQVPVQPSMSNPTPQKDEKLKMTVATYDAEELHKELKQFVFLKVLLLPFIHYKWDTATPLVLQLVTTPLHVYKSNLVQSYLFGAKIDRPFAPPPGPFDQLTKQWNEATAAEPEQTEEKKEKKKGKKNSKG